MENERNTVFIKSYELPDIDVEQVLKYAGVKEGVPEIEMLVDECITEAQGKFSPKVCYIERDVDFCDNTVDLGCFKVVSQSLKKHMQNCCGAIVFAATIGIEIDRLVARYGVISPSKSVICQAIGTERIEALCDMFCFDMQEKMSHAGKTLISRFSPGYGDFPLDFQNEIFAVLDCSRKIGVSLNKSFLMSPTKSVTAIVGIKKQ